MKKSNAKLNNELIQLGRCKSVPSGKKFYKILNIFSYDLTVFPAHITYKSEEVYQPNWKIF